MKVIISADIDPEGLFVTSPQSNNENSEQSNSIDQNPDATMHREMMGDLLGGMIVNSNSGNSYQIQKLAIFTGEDEKFAFKRAVSRIKEMGSSVYLSSGHNPIRLDWQGLMGVRGTPGAIDDLVDGRKVAGTASETKDLIVEDSSKDTLNSKLEIYAIAGEETPRGIERSEIFKLKSHGDDFGDEAGYRGFIQMYKNIDDQNNSVKKMKSLNSDQKPEEIRRQGLDGPVLVGMMAKKENNSPKMHETHFWGFGKWGSRSGKWGEGIRAFWSNIKPK